jgi:hypothetical protein
MSTVGSLDEACHEIRHHLARARRRQPERERVQRLIDLTDALVEELEQLNLAAVRRVGGEWRQRLTSLFSALPYPYVPSLRAHPSPTEVLDVLFDVQALLLDLKRSQSGPGPRHHRQAPWLLNAHWAD